MSESNEWFEIESGFRVAKVERFEETTNKSWDLLVGAKAQSTSVIHKKLKAGGELRWLSDRRGEVPIFMSSLVEESMLDYQFREMVQGKNVDTRLEVLSILMKKEIAQEMEDDDDKGKDAKDMSS